MNSIHSKKYELIIEVLGFRFVWDSKGFDWSFVWFLWSFVWVLMEFRLGINGVSFEVSFHLGFKGVLVLPQTPKPLYLISIA
jgi:hypothetical protein